MTNIVELKPHKRVLEKELQAYLQMRLTAFVADTGLYPKDINIGLIAFSRNDGSIEIVVDEVEAQVAAVIHHELQDDIH